MQLYMQVEDVHEGTGPPIGIQDREREREAAQVGKVMLTHTVVYRLSA